MKTLFEISEQYQSILEEIDFLYSQLDKDNKEIIETQIAKLMGDLESVDYDLGSKLGNYRSIIKNLENNNQEIDQEIQRLKKRKQQNINLIERLKTNIMYQFKELGKTRYETPLYTISIRKNPQKVIITDEHLIPIKYKETIETIKIHKDDIKKDLKLNKKIDGCELIQEERIDIH
jgi:flagellar biosynthesis/type III secretory pathway chaperone